MYGTVASSGEMTETFATYDSFNGRPYDETITFTPATTATYYFGFNAFSIPDQYYICLLYTSRCV